MNDPARWASLNESERAVLRAARSTRNAKAAWFISPSDGAARAWGTEEGNLTSATNSLTDDDPPPGVIEMPAGWTFHHESTWDFAHVTDDAGNRMMEIEDGQINAYALPGPHPLAAVALLLRSAGWRVEGPR